MTARRGAPVGPLDESKPGYPFAEVLGAWCERDLSRTDLATKLDPRRNQRWLDRAARGESLLTSEELDLILARVRAVQSPDEGVDWLRAFHIGDIRAQIKFDKYPRRPSLESVMPLDIVGIGALNYDHVVPMSAYGAKYADKNWQPLKFTSEPERVRSTEEELIKDLIDNLADTDPTVGVATQHRLGGSAFNVIQLLASPKLACRTGFVGVSGSVPADETGSRVQLPTHRDFLQQGRGVPTDCSFLKSSDQASGRCASVLKPSRREDEVHRKMSVWQGANVELYGHLVDNFWQIANYLRSATAVHVSSLFDANAPEVIADLLEYSIGREPGQLISFDPGHLWSSNEIPAVRRILKVSRLLFVNEDELPALAQTYFDAGDAGAHAAAERLLQEMRTDGPASIVMVKHKGSTSIYSTNAAPDQIDITPLRKEEVEDDTGAGDAFAACYLAGRLSPFVIGRLGAIFGMLTVRSKLSHVGPPTGDDVLDVLERLAAMPTTSTPIRDTSSS